MLFGDVSDYKMCPHCSYRMFKPFPTICPNPNCLKAVDKEDEDTFAKHLAIKTEETVQEIQLKETEVNTEVQLKPIKEKPPEKIKPIIKKPEIIVKEIEISKNTASRKIKGVRVKKKVSGGNINFSNNIIVVPENGQYFKNYGIVESNSRIVLYNKNPDFSYIQDLSCNLDFIASSIMGGEIDRLILESELSHATEKILYIKEKGIIYYVYGMFPDKHGYFILKQMKKVLKTELMGRKVDKLQKFELAQFQRKFSKKLGMLMSDYLKLDKILSENEIPSLDVTFNFDYFGMSYKSIGTISKLLSDNLPIELNMDISKAQLLEMKESLITAKIEAIAANTIANTQANPHYLSVKLGYDKYKYLLFEKLTNDYFLYILADGNLEKYREISSELVDITKEVTKKPFKGDLKPFIKLRKELLVFFEKQSELSRLSKISKLS